MLGGALVPHAPVLLAEVSPHRAREADEAKAALAKLTFPGARLIVLCSPHGRASGVYATARGDLAGFGVPHVAVDIEPDADAASELARLWERPLLDERLDHGVVVPLLLAQGARSNVVCCVLREGAGDEAWEDARALAQSVATFARRHDVIVLVSAHTGAGLSARAPIPQTPERRRVEEAVRAALAEDPGALVELAPILARDGGSCSATTLLLFGHLFARRSATLLAIAEPFGVGYPVVEVR